MSAWRNITIGQLIDAGAADVQTGPFGTQLRASDYVDAGRPVINVRNIGFGRLKPEKLEYVDERTAARLSSHLLKAHDLVFARKGAVDRHLVVQDTQNGWMQGSDCIRVRLDRNVILPEFVSYTFQRNEFKEWMMQQCSHGATMATLNQNVISRIAICAPDLAEQCRIASILGAYDDLIEVNRRRIALLEEMARRLFEEWFVHFRFPSHDGHAMVDTPDGPLPEGWWQTTLGAICDKITDGAHKSPSSVEVGQLMASVKDMRDWDFDLSGCRQISAEHFEELVRNGCQPSVGDILIAKDGANLNKHTFLMWREVPLVLLSSIAILRPPEDFEREYLVALLKSDVTSEAIKRMKSGAAIPRIVLRDFKRLRIMLPPPELRRKFDNTVGPMHELIRRISLANGQLAKSRDLILPRLISGALAIATAERELEAVA